MGSTLCCSSCNMPVMELEYAPASWAASEIDDLRSDMEDKDTMIMELEETLCNSEEDCNELNERVSTLEENVKTAVGDENKSIMWKLLALVDIVEEYEKHPADWDTTKLRRLRTKGGLSNGNYE